MKPPTPEESSAFAAAAQASLERGTLVAEHVALLAEWREMLAKVDAARTEFDQVIYLAGHDLRAPLRGIAHLSQWIEEDIKQAVAPTRLSESLGDKLKLLRSRVTRLERLIGGLLAYSRAGHGSFEDARSQNMSFGDDATLLEVCEAVARTPIDAADDDLGRVALIAGDGSDVRLGALPALRLTLGHLVGNAARHGRIGAQQVHVAVSARLVSKAGEKRTYEVTIADDGPGIEPRHHARIWELFQTLEPRDRSETAGCGLAIVRRVVGRLGGTIGVESQLGAGAAFRFTWPGMPQLQA